MRTPSRRRPSARPQVEALESRVTPATLSNFLTTQHVDLNLSLSGTTFGLQPRDADNVVSYPADDGLLYVGVNAAQPRPAGSAFDFIGVAAGETFFRLPQNQDSNLMYLGVAGYGVAGGAVNKYDPAAESGGRVTGTAGWVRLTLDGVAGPGQFSVWQSGDAGPVPFMATAAGGVTAADSLWVIAGGHSHFNYGFTAPGRYEVTFRVSASVNTDGNTSTQEPFVTSDPITAFFSVGNVGRFAVDPASYAIDEAAGMATVTVRRSGGSDGRVTVAYATADVTATAGQDYTAASGTLTFNDGETVKTVAVPIIDDTVQEPDETFTLTLTNPGPAAIAGYAVGLPGGSLLGTPATATVTIRANDAPGANTPPTISPIGGVTTPEDTAATVAFTVGDAQTPAGQLTVTAVSSNPAVVPAGGLVLGGSGADRTLTVTPAANAFGTADVTVTVTDAGGLTASRTFAVTVTPVNDPPTISFIPDQVMDEDGTLVIPFTVGDVETAATGLTVTRALSQVTPSTVLFTSGVTLSPASGGADRTVTIRPRANQFGSARVTLTVRDAAGATTPVSFLVTVNPVNDPPTAVPDNLLAVPGTTSTLTILDNDFHVDPGATFTLQSFTQPANGTLVAGPDGRTVRYTPAAGFTGADEFTYTLVDGDGDTATTTGYVTVAPYLVVDSPTTALHTDTFVNYVNGEWQLNIKTDLRFGPPGPPGIPTLGGAQNPTILDSDEGAYFADPTTKTSRPANNDFGNFDFIGVPAGSDVWVLPPSTSGHQLYLGLSTEGTDPGTFAEFTSTDPRVTGQTTDWMIIELVGFSGPGHFSLFDFGFDAARVWIDTADGLNSPADAVAGGNPADSVWIQTGSHSHFNWVFTAAGRYELALRATGFVASGAVDADGNPVLTPVTSPVATYTFDVDTLSTQPLGENPPLARADAATAVENGGPVSINVLANDSSSPDPVEALTVTAATPGASGGTASVAADGRSVLYTPAAGFAGTDTFTYTLTDEHGGTATAAVTVTVTAINQPPVANPDAFGVLPGNSVRGNLLANDIDRENDPLTAALATAPGSGTAAVRADGSFTYTPGANFTGTDTFNYTASDGAGGTATGTVTITGRPAHPLFDAVLSEEHVDVGIAYEDGEFEPHIHDEDNDVEYGPGGALLHVRPQAATPRPADPAFDFLGVPAGATYYRLPQTPTGGLLLLGLGAEEIPDGVFAGDRVSVRLTAVDGPGQFALWQNTDFGPAVLMATADGVTAADMTSVLTGGHVDLNWGFTARGLYAVTVQFSGFLIDGTFVESGEATYYFAVDPANAAPVTTAPAAVATPFGSPVGVAVSVADADPHARPLRVTVTATNGTLTLGPAAGLTSSAGDGTAAVTIEGNLAALNAALAGLTFTPAAGFSGRATVTVTADDRGFLVEENALTDVDVITVDVALPPAPPSDVAVEVVSNGAEGGADGQLRFTRTGGDLTLPLTVTYTVGGTATPGADYAALPGSVTFAPGQTAVTVSFAVVDDVLVEGVETVVVTLTPGAGYTAATGPATVMIADNDTAPPPVPPVPPAVPPTVPPAVPPVPAGFAVGSGSGGAARLLNPDRTERLRVEPFGPGYAGGVRVASADVTGDGVLDLIVGAGPGGGPRVVVYDGVTQAVIADFFAFEPTFTGGVFVTAGDLDGDGKAEVIVTPDVGGGPVVAVYSGAKVTAGLATGAFGQAAQVARFFGIDDPAFRGGARAGAGDMTGDGRADLVVSAGTGGGPRVAVFDGATVGSGQTPRRLVADFFAFEPALRNGSFVAVGDATGDGRADVLFGAGPGGGPRVRVLDGPAMLAGREQTLADFFPGDSADRSGVRVAAADVDGDGRAELVVGTAGGPGRAFVYSLPGGGPVLLDELDGFGDGVGGVFVG